MIPSLSDNEIEDRYFLQGRMEILNVLNELIHRRESVMVYFHNGRDFFITTLLEARPGVLVFDLSGDEQANLRLPKSASCVFVSRLNGIRVQFSGSQAQRFSWGGSDAFWVPLPERIVRMQRRESYRILLPIAKPMMVKLFSDNDVLLEEWPAHDLSVGGLGFTVTGKPQLLPDQSIARLYFSFSRQRVINCKVAVRHVTHIADLIDGARYRIGVMFSDLPPSIAVAIQRYIVKLEQERRGVADAGAHG